MLSGDTSLWEGGIMMLGGQGSFCQACQFMAFIFLIS